MLRHCDCLLYKTKYLLQKAYKALELYAWVIISNLSQFTDHSARSRQRRALPIDVAGGFRLYRFSDFCRQMPDTGHSCCLPNQVHSPPSRYFYSIALSFYFGVLDLNLGGTSTTVLLSFSWFSSVILQKFPSLIARLHTLHYNHFPTIFSFNSSVNLY